MRRYILLMAAMFMAVMFGMSGTASADMKAKGMVMVGTVIDTKCATDNKADLAAFIKTHTKECAMLPPCHASGYNLYYEGKLIKFDKKSSDKVFDFLKKADSKLDVKVKASHNKDGTLKLMEISNA